MENNGYERRFYEKKEENLKKGELLSCSTWLEGI